jgi:hypothetical protein
LKHHSRHNSTLKNDKTESDSKEKGSKRLRNYMRTNLRLNENEFVIGADGEDE